jgi:uncharacterized protein YoxC
MGKIYQVVKIIAVACVIPLTIYTCMFLNTLKETTIATGKVIDALPGKVDTLQTNVLAKIDTVQAGLSSDIHFVANTGDSRLATLTKTADTRLGSLQDDTLEQVKGLRSDINTQLTQTNATITTVAKAYADIPGVVGARLDKYTDCTKNELCLQGQLSDTMLALRTTSRDVSTTMEGVNSTLPGIEKDIKTVTDSVALAAPAFTNNVSAIAANINRLTHPRWWERAISYGAMGVGIYRDLNPITSITLAPGVFFPPRLSP